MKALYSVSGRVPISRVLREYRAGLVPVAVVLIANVVALGALVLPLSTRVTAAEARAEAAEGQRATAEADLRQAETLREAKVRAGADLDRFYREVLPPNIAAARRILQLKLRQLASSHDVEFQGGGSTEEELVESSLLRLAMSMRLVGSYDDIRGFLFDLETSPDFVVIDDIRLTEQPRSSELSVLLELSTYYRAPGATPPAAEDQATQTSAGQGRD